ncbi:hypothetical protein DP73_18045 [Desulfosporosinus sp. HMP52]|uniref:SMI1/KNR4 family protein n=1 Tax=Desulfosporosinus sp. HMP52 TaxID=1487923 RepID=UPI00051FDF77|nr:SMI1/KNR4 family protein [Desulfosporosinus sp. HMP52]KGK85832.1 hypothetical protein DP73_18045 [Desulfosporosinus sp. HMP52]
MENTNSQLYPNLGISIEQIGVAADAMGIKFQEQLTSIWQISNGIELPGGWLFYPVFDKSNPRKTSNHIVYENTKGRWPYMSDEFISIAGNDTGNQLVIKKSGSTTDTEIFVWNHETNKIKKWSKNLNYIKEQAIKRVEKVNTQIKRGLSK